LVCADKPAIPLLAAPNDGAEVKKRRLRLAWEGVECAGYYQLQVRRDTRKGEWVVREKQIEDVVFRTEKLDKDVTYAWRTRACNDAGCGRWTKWGEFLVVGKQK
jgi:hypothetical protein